MPLAKSSSRIAFLKNVTELVRSGRKVNQAVAIAYKEKRAAKAKGK